VFGIVIVVGLWALAAASVQAQSASLYQRTPGHRFSFQSDSTTAVIDVLEYRLNQRWLMLRDWCNEKRWNWSPITDTDTNEITDQALSMISRTKTFPVRVGDTLSAFRWFYIMDATRDTISFEFSDQTVDSWAVMEFVDDATQQVVAVLDTVRFSSVGRQMCIRSTRPAIARVVYIVPPDVTASNGYIRMRVGNAEGDDHHWFRHDAIMDVVSWKLLPRSAAFNDRYRVGNACEQGMHDPPLTIQTLSGRSGVKCASRSREDMFATITGVDGFQRASIRVPSGSQGIEVDLQPGLYYISVRTVRGMHVGTKNVIVE
jgi:hypothetical protein